MILRSVIINNFDVAWSIRCPLEADPELVVDPDAELACAVASEGFKAIAGWNPQVSKFGGSIQHRQFPHGDRFKVHKPLDALSSEQIARVMTLER